MSPAGSSPFAGSISMAGTLSLCISSFSFPAAGDAPRGRAGASEPRVLRFLPRYSARMTAMSNMPNTTP